MRRSLSYKDAVKLLAGGENKFLKLLDDAGSVVMFGTGVFDLFEAKTEALRLADKLLTKFGEKLRGTDRLTRTERIEAAHHIVQITAYFDAFAAAMNEFRSGRTPRFSAAEQASLATGTISTEIPSDWRVLFGELAQVNHRSPIYDTDPAGTFYDFSERVERHLHGLAIWDALNETERSRLSEQLREHVPTDAAIRYQEYMRQLAVECPEFQVWLNLEGHSATRDRLATGLADLEELLAPLIADPASGQQAALARAHRADLAKPIVLTSGPESGLALPSLGEGYVDHRFRIAFSTRPTDLEWQGHRVHSDLPVALGAYLQSSYARSAPLLILGQPGSGKSVLTRILAARLPAERFLPIRIELRHVDADADLQDHIEAAIREQTGEQIQWTRFVAANADVLPVVILDGFDELLQATGVTQTDFLLRVERFQEREIDQGRAVAAIVTSRTAVADRATIPHDTPIIRLEPFDDEQIAAWVEIWNRTNGASLAARGVKPLSATTITRYRTLAEQPLLLLMLALYDATDNALTAVDPGLDQSAVYEQLLRAFARRELAKDPDTTDLEQRIEHELLRLSVVAFAMFTRGQQWIDDESLTADLRALGIWEAQRNAHTLRSTLSAGQQMVGRFFFVHDSQATRDGRELQTYEFLHATFSEYLIARLVDRLLAELAQQHMASARALTRTINDGLLYALLSFDSLAVRAPIVEFTGALLARHDPTTRRAIDEVLVQLYHDSLKERTDRSYTDYQPASLDVVQRASRWNANLVLLMAFAPDGVSMRRLYPARNDSAVDEWHRISNLWRSCMRGESWNGLADNLVVERVWVDDGRDLVIRVGTPPAPSTTPDLKWSYHRSAKEWKDGTWWDSHVSRSLQQRANFLWYRRMDLAVHNVLPIAAELPTLANTVYNTQDGRLVSATSLLLSALVAPYRAEPADSAILDLARTLRFLPRQVPEHERRLFGKLALGLIVAAVEQGAVPAEDHDELRFQILLRKPLGDDRQLVDLLAHLDKLLTERALPTSAASPAPAPSPATSSPETPATPPAAP